MNPDPESCSATTSSQWHKTHSCYVNKGMKGKAAAGPKPPRITQLLSTSAKKQQQGARVGDEGRVGSDPDCLFGVVGKLHTRS